MEGARFRLGESELDAVRKEIHGILRARGRTAIRILLDAFDR